MKERGVFCGLSPQPPPISLELRNLYVIGSSPGRSAAAYERPYLIIYRLFVPIPQPERQTLPIPPTLEGGLHFHPGDRLAVVPLA